MEDHIYAAGSDEPSGVKSTSKPMKWTTTKDVMLAREIMLVDPFRHRKNTRERGKAWASVAENLAKHDEFKVEQRSVRDRYAHLKFRTERRNRDEAKASGISPDVDELDVLMEDLINKDNDSENCVEAASDELKRLNGVEMRKRGLETFVETRERLKKGEEKEAKRSRKSGGDTMQFLLEKMNIEMEWKKQEMELRKKELEQEAARRQREEAERDRRHEMLQQQVMQQNQSMTNMMMMMMEFMKNK